MVTGHSPLGGHIVIISKLLGNLLTDAKSTDELGLVLVRHGMVGLTFTVFWLM